MRAEARTDTICAIATPPGAGGIGVIRISGPKAFDILEQIWRGRVSGGALQPRRLSLGEALDERGEVLDRAMAVRLPGPQSYTGQDMAEISCHGSRVVLSRLLAAAIAAGARPAGPGEFTRRAFLSGKLDLVQAEAVCELIRAEGERGARLASEQLEGRLSSEVRSLGKRLLQVRAALEAGIDFPDEGIEAAHLPQELQAVIQDAAGLAATYREGRLVREGVRLAIIGRPNAGKSSILNALCGSPRAIVHAEPGTTRDVVEAAVSIEGIVFHLRDTAGLREAASEVEAIGVQRARREVEQADLVLAVFDGAANLGSDDRAVLALTEGRPTVFIVNKIDLPQRIDPAAIDVAGRGRAAVKVSARSGAGMEGLRRALVEHIGDPANGGTAGVHATVTSARHKGELDRAIAALGSASAALGASEPLECIAQHLRRAQAALGAITGEVTTEELLESIFSQFCIGK